MKMPITCGVGALLPVARGPGLQLCSDVGHALHEVEGGQQQVFLGVGSHAQQVVLAKVAIHEREQVALGVIDAELRDHLLDEVWRYALGELHRRRQPRRPTTMRT
jgi:hypothetical protein